MTCDEYIPIVRAAEALMPARGCPHTDEIGKTLDAERTRCRVICEQLWLHWMGREEKQKEEAAEYILDAIADGRSWHTVKRDLKKRGEW